MSDIKFPKPDIFAPVAEKKTTKFGLQLLKWVQYNHCQSDWRGYKDRREKYQENYVYSYGIQGNSKFKRMFSKNGDKSWLPIDYRILAILPKYIDQEIGRASKQEYKISCNAIDPETKMERDDRLAKAHADFMVNQLLKSQIEPIVGQKLTPDKNPHGDTPEEIELAFKNSKLQKEIKRELAIKYYFWLNNWKYKELEVRRHEVMQPLSATYTCVKNGTICIDVIDIRNLVIPYTTTMGALDALPYYGYYISITAAELKRCSNFTDEEMAEIIAKCDTGNQAVQSIDITQPNWLSKWNDYTISVLYAEIECYDTEVYEKRSSKKSNRYFIEKQKSIKSEKKDYNIEDINSGEKCLYCGYWVVGTDYIYGYGRKKNMLVPKDNPKGVVSGFTVYRHDEASKVDKCIPIVDEMQRTHLKKQQMKMAMSPPKMWIDERALQNTSAVGLGGENMGTLEVIEMGNDTGKFIVNTTDIEGNGNYRPMGEIPSSIFQDINALQGMYESEKQEIRDILGTNELADSSNPPANTLVGVQKEAVYQSMDNSKPLNDAYLYIFEKTAEKIGMYVDYMALVNGKLSVNLPIGLFEYDNIEYTKEEAKANYGIMVEASPDIQERQDFEQNIQFAQANGELTLGDVMYIKRLAYTNLKLANLVLEVRAAKNKAAQQQIAAENAQQNAAVQQQTIQMQTQMAESLEQFKNELTKDLETHKAALKDELNANDAHRKGVLDNNATDNQIEANHIDKFNQPIETNGQS